ncbi:MAG: type II restriction endonuclease [Fusobacteriaceae bacterium]|nr:type II restriction endonuclease [Fusobacteriaceae bacterium]
MNKRNFNEWLDKFRNSISNYRYYVDFEKVFKNVDNIKIELNILNSLIGSKNIQEDFENIVKKYPEVLKCVPILLAVRTKEIYVIDAEGEFNYSFKNKNYSISEYSKFMEKTGLFELLEKHLINNLIDYVTGVETGLDSNGRKNRGGHLMEDLVETFIQKAGFEKSKNYFKEMYISEIENKWKINLSGISNMGKTEKRFDFVIKTEKQIYVVETNFYASSGSKLNETARSYKTITNEIAAIDGITFVWFTDGIGWKNAKNNLEETFDVLEDIYNINDLENGIMKKIFV